MKMINLFSLFAILFYIPISTQEFNNMRNYMKISSDYSKKIELNFRKEKEKIIKNLQGEGRKAFKFFPPNIGIFDNECKYFSNEQIKVKEELLKEIEKKGKILTSKGISRLHRLKYFCDLLCIYPPYKIKDDNENFLYTHLKEGILKFISETINSALLPDNLEDIMYPIKILSPKDYILKNHQI